MKILLIGASGMIGSRVLNEAVSRGHEVIAAVRHPGRVASLPGVTVVTLDVTDPEAVAQAARGVDAIVGAASPRSTGDGTAEMARIGNGYIEGARAVGTRLLVVGGAGSLNQADGQPLFPMLEGILPPEALPEVRGMRAFKDVLVQSDVDWTFFAPPLMIAPGERTGVFRLGGTTLVSNADGSSGVSAEDYAVALVDELETPAHRRQIFTVGY